MARHFASRCGLAVALMGTLALGACSTNIDHRGNLPEKKKVATIKPGTTTRGQVLRLLGKTPTIDLQAIIISIAGRHGT